MNEIVVTTVKENIYNV